MTKLEGLLESIVTKINQHENEHPMVIHCVKGQNRSAAAVLYWLVMHERMTFEDALQHLRKCRDILIDPHYIRKIKKLAMKKAQLSSNL